MRLLNAFSLQVSKERGEELAIEYGIKFMETSAKASINVEEAFFTLARDIKAKMEKRLVSIHNFNPSYRSNIQDSSFIIILEFHTNVILYHFADCNNINYHRCCI